MKVYVSYSFSDSELHLITLLLEKFREQGHIVESTANFIGYDFRDVRYKKNNTIINSDFFVGIVTNNSVGTNNVISDWDIANKNGVKCILLVERGVVIPRRINFLEFDRNNPQSAINKLFEINKLYKNNGDDFLIALGIILGIAALISLFSNSKD